LIGVNPEPLDLALQGWNDQFAKEDEGLAVDGKTLCNAIDDDGRQTQILGVVDTLFNFKLNFAHIYYPLDSGIA
jgi:hypothetical protein